MGANGDGIAAMGRSYSARSKLARLELIRVQLVASQQLVEVRSISFRKARGLADVTHRYLQNLRQVVASKFIARVAE